MSKSRLGRKFWTFKPAEAKEEGLSGVSRAQDNPPRLRLGASIWGPSGP